MEDYIKNLLTNACTGFPIIILNTPNPTTGDNYPCVTFDLYLERGSKFGNGVAEEETGSCQVDIWYKVKNTAIKNVINNIKTALKNEKYFTYPQKENMYESDTKIFHTYFTFNYLLLESED